MPAAKLADLRARAAAVWAVLGRMVAAEHEPDDRVRAAEMFRLHEDALAAGADALRAAGGWLQAALRAVGWPDPDGWCARLRAALLPPAGFDPRVALAGLGPFLDDFAVLAPILDGTPPAGGGPCTAHDPPPDPAPAGPRPGGDPGEPKGSTAAGAEPEKDKGGRPRADRSPEEARFEAGYRKAYLEATDPGDGGKVDPARLAELLRVPGGPFGSVNGVAGALGIAPDRAASLAATARREGRGANPPAANKP